MQIKDMPAGERPQEKLMYYGAGALSNTELLSLIIRSGIKGKSALEMAGEIIAYAQEEIGGLDGACASELMRVSGVGAGKACSIVAAFELGRRMGPDKQNKPRPVVKSTLDAVNLLRSDFDCEKREHIIELIMNSRCEVEAKQIISIGELSSTVAGPREILSPAIRRGAAGIILAHNHPSGDPNPSSEDIKSTKKLAAAAGIVGIKLLDHIIIGRSSFVSLREKGIIQ
ncbi:MAG: DNA repair protein RadC [Firmicutes bacterium]|nr:DNA repair protein RadC [Bacillota bacterium]